MAYYKKYESSSAKRRRESSAWNDQSMEDSFRSGKSTSRTGKQDQHGDRGVKHGKPGRSVGPRRPGRKPPMESRPRRMDAPEAPQKKTYLDFEHVPSTPIRETNLEQDNLLSGRNPIREAIRSGRAMEKILVASGELSGSAREIIRMAREARIPVQEVDKKHLDEIAPHHQGMIAYASAYRYSTVQDILDLAASRHEDPFIILLDGITDPHNLGAIIRTAECVGAHGVIVPERRSVGLTPAAVKASAGAIEHVQVARVPNLNRILDEFKKQRIWTYALTMNGTDYQSVNFRGATALVIGGEGDGVSRLTEESCDVRVSLPLMGKIDSLNASVAAGVIMYQVLQSRRK